VTVLRDGNFIDTAEVKDISIRGSSKEGGFRAVHRKATYRGDRTPVLRWRGLLTARPGGGYAVNHVSFTLHRGEVLGIYGLMGAGRTELVESLMGLHPESTGRMRVRGEPVDRPSVAGQIARGMVLVPEDRQKDGLVQTMSIAGNMRLTAIPRFTKRLIIDEKRCLREIRETVREMQIKVADVNHLITSLSGGNQQKVVIGKCVLAEADIFMMGRALPRHRCGRQNRYLHADAQVRVPGHGRIVCGQRTQGDPVSLRPGAGHVQRQADRRPHGG
jgi:ABC-type sugar transport system ATPase subunit